MDDTLYVKFGLRAFALIILTVILTILSVVVGCLISGYSPWDIARAALYGGICFFGLIFLAAAGFTWPLDRTISLLGLELSNE